MTHNFISKKNGSDDLLQATSQECKQLLAKLKNVVTSSDKMHTELHPRKTVETEVFPDVIVLFKVKLKDEEPPCTL